MNDDWNRYVNNQQSKGRIINPCDSAMGHLWRSISETTSQCMRCGECATSKDFKMTEKNYE